MANQFFLAPTKNFTQKNLFGTISSGATTITLKDTTNVQGPGYIVIDRTDINGNLTTNNRETVYFTGVSGSNLTGCTRGADNDSAIAHADGAVVEFTFTEGMWNSLSTIVSTAFTSDGYLKPIASPASISIMQISTQLSVSGASVTGAFPLYPVFQFVGGLSGPTTNPQTPLSMPHPGSFQWISVTTRTTASTASAIIDPTLNGASIFDLGLQPTIAPGATYASTASIKTKAFVQGAQFGWNYNTTGGLITDFVIQAGT